MTKEKDFYLKVPEFIDDCEKLNYKLYRDKFYKVENCIKELDTNDYFWSVNWREIKSIVFIKSVDFQCSFFVLEVKM